MSANIAKEITTFSVLGVNGSIVGQNITVTLPYGTSVTSLTPTIVHTGSSVSPASGVAHNFTSPQTYTVTAADGTTKDYTVTVTVSANSAKEITNFSILGMNGVITGQNILVTVPYGTPSLTYLTPTVTQTGASVSPASGVAQNFTSSKTYTVTAADNTTKAYTVTVTIAANPRITGFTIPNQELWTTIDDVQGTISVTMPYLTNVTSLTPTITTNAGSSVDPASGVAKDFTNPVYYIVSSGSSMKLYSVTVTVSSSVPAGYPAAFSAAGVNFNMYYIPSGLTFKATVIDNTPTTIANAYWIGETHVTYELWYVVKSWGTANGYTFGNSGREGNDGVIGAAPTTAKQEPVTAINWRDAMIWMNALTEWYNAVKGTQYTCAYYTDAAYTTPIRTSTTSATITYTTNGSQDAPYVKADANGFRMLASQEWELAARYKGADSSNGAYEWPVGSGKWWTPGTYASGATAAATDKEATKLVGWFINSDGGDAGGMTHDVKLKNPDVLALYDMDGNVWQWNFDWGPSNIGSQRVAHGSSWGHTASSMQVGWVGIHAPSATNSYYSIRFARTY